MKLKRSLSHLALICFLVVVSGCGGSMEMCADQKFQSIKLDETHNNCSMHMTKRQKDMSVEERIFRQVENPRGFYSQRYYDCAYEENLKDREVFLSQSVKNKLINNAYEYGYSNCELMKKRNPETFDAKY